MNESLDDLAANEQVYDCVANLMLTVNSRGYYEIRIQGEMGIIFLDRQHKLTNLEIETEEFPFTDLNEIYFVKTKAETDMMSFNTLDLKLIEQNRDIISAKNFALKFGA